MFNGPASSNCKRDPRVPPGIGLPATAHEPLDELRFPTVEHPERRKWSLVGPLGPSRITTWSNSRPGISGTFRTRVLPSLTGLQVSAARSDGGDISVQEALDTYYIRNWSPWLDLYILARTVTAVLLARGAY